MPNGHSRRGLETSIHGALCVCSFSLYIRNMCVEKERIEKKREKKTECQKPLVFLFVEFDGGEEDQEKKEENF